MKNQKAKIKNFIRWGKLHPTFTEVVAETSQLKRASSIKQRGIFNQKKPVVKIKENL